MESRRVARPGGRPYSLVQVDVFTDRPLAGNPLAVFPDARGLSDGEMQAIAREMNLSETTFVLPRDPKIERARGIRVRIFTVREELPFAGHPTLGTAFVLRGQGGGPEVALELGVGRVPVRFEEAPGRPPFGEMTQVDPVLGEAHDRTEVARALGVPVEALHPHLPVQTVSTGLPFVVVPFRSLAVLRDLVLDVQRSDAWLLPRDARHFYLVALETESPAARLHARMIFYGGEDPATGSASGCAAAWMVAHGVAAPDERVLIEQGLEVRRPSRIHVRASRTGSRVHSVRVGGNAVEILRGELTL
ncbi:MAG TPA: PhzF family phenazine biosynthesis protein [Anaeromyxobacteraceae bacterium]|nr:PhzF family phenazine biosynthesis protein [Anaeromyxobacteraceae bacterium]